MDEERSPSRAGGRDVGPACTAAPASPVLSPRPPPPERGRYRPLRGLEELLDDVLGRVDRTP